MCVCICVSTGERESLTLSKEERWKSISIMALASFADERKR